MGDLIPLPACRRSAGPSRRGMNSKKVVSGQLFTFPLRRLNDVIPIVGRDSFSLLPLADSPMTLTDGIGHFGKGVPDLEHIANSLHIPDNVSDNSSGQGLSIIPMTAPRQGRTIRPMGRGTTPARFRNEMAEKLKSARIVARYETQLQAAQALGVGLDRYRKWESGRTPVPAQYIPAVCDLFGIDANYLFSVQPKAARKSA